LIAFSFFTPLKNVVDIYRFTIKRTPLFCAFYDPQNDFNLFLSVGCCSSTMKLTQLYARRHGQSSKKCVKYRRSILYKIELSLMEKAGIQSFLKWLISAFLPAVRILPTHSGTCVPTRLRGNLEYH